jgi:hypothetical protein
VKRLFAIHLIAHKEKLVGVRLVAGFFQELLQFEEATMDIADYDGSGSRAPILRLRVHVAPGKRTLPW